MSVQWTIRSFKTLKSTQLTLKDIINEEPDIFEGIVVKAEQQTKGQGRHGRVWEQGTGNLYLSFMITPNCAPKDVGQISLITGLAVNKTIHDYIPDINTKLKWPNDILINDQKCCGILIEALHSDQNKVKNLIIGIGVNIASSPIEMSSNLSDYSRNKIDSTSFQNSLLDNFSQYYSLWKRHGFEKFLYEWLSFTYKEGALISVKSGHKGQTETKGRFKTIDSDGNLIIICAQSDKPIKITSGEVFIL